MSTRSTTVDSMALTPDPHPDLLSQTCVEITDVLGISISSISSISHANNTITLTHAQARRLLVLAKAGKEAQS